MKTKIFFFGTPEIAVPSLQALATNEAVEIVGVGVFPDRKVGRKQILTPCAVKVAATDLSLPIFEIDSKEALLKVTSEVEFDLGIVIAFGMIFPKALLERPQQTFVNVHFSLLPRYRGASPVQSAILDGEDQSGITWQLMASALDAGDILMQTKHNITGQKTSEVFTQFAEHTAAHFNQFIRAFTDQSLKPTKQDESEASFCGKFTKADGEIFPHTETAQTIYQKYLAFDIWPGIFLSSALGPVKIKSLSPVPTLDTIKLNCAEDTKLYLKTVQIPGKKPQPVQAVLNGHPHLFS